MSVPSIREETIFEQALHMDSAPARDAYLREACGEDRAMLARLQGLLGAHDRAGKFLAHKPSAAASPSPAAAVGVPPSGGPANALAEAGTPNSTMPVPSEKPGDRIGRYKLLEEIGEGGFGTVWMAEQEEPVRRRVALKVIKVGMDTRQVLARFEAERQALALMDHPNIARVFDGGATGSAESEISNQKSDIPKGRPYFVMELVRGQPITKYCEQAGLSTRQRLELFGQVCRAVQHAHQKGIIHRDIKPSNILVTVQEYFAVERAAPFKSEFYDGEMFAMAGGSPMHALIAANLIRELGTKLKGRPCKLFTRDLRLKVEGTGLCTYPDVSVICGPLQFAAGTEDTVVNPTLLIEVLSDSTEAYDRGEKFLHFRQMPSLKEYLLVSQRLPRVEQFLRRPGDEWTLRTAEGREATLALSSLEITLELNEVFAGVDLAPASIRAQVRPPV